LTKYLDKLVRWFNKILHKNYVQKKRGFFLEIALFHKKIHTLKLHIEHFFGRFLPILAFFEMLNGNFLNADFREISFVKKNK